MSVFDFFAFSPRGHIPGGWQAGAAALTCTSVSFSLLVSPSMSVLLQVSPQTPTTWTPQSSFCPPSGILTVLCCACLLICLHPLQRVIPMNPETLLKLVTLVSRTSYNKYSLSKHKDISSCRRVHSAMALLVKFLKRFTLFAGMYACMYVFYRFNSNNLNL